MAKQETWLEAGPDGVPVEMAERELTWTDFCQWLAGKRVVQSDESGDGSVELTFDDGTRATVQSTRSEGSPGYSEYTPGSDGHLTTPTVTICEKVNREQA